MINRLLELLDNPETDGDDDGYEPTPQAIRVTFSLVIQAIMESGVHERFSPTVTGDGGVRVTWDLDNNRRVVLAVPGEEHPYLYFGVVGPDADNGIVDNPTYLDLAEKLKWLVS